MNCELVGSATMIFRAKRRTSMVMTHVILAISACLYPLNAEETIDISNGPQLFLDDHLVRATTNTKRTLMSPEKHADNPVIVPENPWEKRILEIYGTVLFDSDQSKFRCWYLANEFKDGIPDTPGHPRTAEYYTCYAESTDGIDWTKPPVGVGAFGVHSRHNVIIRNTHGFCVLPTPDDPDPARKYKGAGGALVGTSPDGIEWRLRDWRDAVGKNDTSTCIVRWKGEYLAFVRAQVKDPNWPAVMRGVGLSTSADFEQWSPKQTVLITDTDDGYPWVQPYGISVTPYGDVLIGLLWLLHLDQAPNNNSIGYQDVQLVVSRDGRNWTRVADRAVFLAGTPGAWDQGRVFPGTTMFVKDNRVHIYFTGVETRHGEGWGAMGIGLATLPADRFVALGPYDSSLPAVIETKPLAFDGVDLIVNAAAAPGDLRVELLDSSGAVLDGYNAEQSRLIACDPLRYRVVWQSPAGDRTLNQAVTGRPIALRFTIQRGALYAFQVTD
ncbi:MAG: hypothetical protein HUU46_09670 [Candidatus Hydrogenedentes bacterium]|nr:hypothetical protein [Candidatus Hydrogenedentota bacterium]